MRAGGARPPALVLAAAVSTCLLLLLPARAAPEAQPAAFLQSKLPCRVLAATPAELAADKGDAAALVTLSGRQAITAVFSRPVIALGSDWGSQELPAALVPFTLSCNVPGRLRWVTTTIARFDPSVDWPTDLDCSFNWNRSLKTYDGVPLQLGPLAPSVRLASQPLEMSLERVSSAAAMAATGDQWSATAGLPDDRLPEVPPDGNITVSFSYPVDLARLAKALQLTGPGADGRSLRVSPCASPAALPPLPVPLADAAADTDAPQGVDGAGALQQQQSATCAVVKIEPGLQAGAAAVLRLPQGARYSQLAGPVTKPVDLRLYGLRPFRIPLSWEFVNITKADEPIYNGVTYRRLTLWLPHGLAAGTKLPDVASRISLCRVDQPFGGGAKAQPGKSGCTPQAFELSRAAKAQLVMTVPGLSPRTRYAVSIKADPQIKDGFGLPLQASGDEWWTTQLGAAFQGPEVGEVALLEAAPGNPPLLWPWVSRGKPEEATLTQVQAWTILGGGDNASAAGAGTSSGLLHALAGVATSYQQPAASTLGSAAATLTRPTARAPSFQALRLPGGPGASYVGACCRPQSWPTPRSVLTRSSLVVTSDLQAAFAEGAGRLLAWVTRASGAGEAVPGARVQVYATKYGQDAASEGPSCTTGADGTCSLDLADAKPSAGSVSLSAVVTAPGHGPLVVPSLPYSASPRNGGPGGSAEGFVGTLVLDRRLVKPGDKLRVTGYIQRREGTQLKAPTGLSSVVLQVTPSFDGPAGGGASPMPRGPSRPGQRGGAATHITLTVDPVVGSVHGVVPVPANATPASYSLQLWTALPGSEQQGGGGGGEPVPLAVAMPLAVQPAVSLAEPMPAPGAISTSKPAPKALPPSLPKALPPPAPGAPAAKPGSAATGGSVRASTTPVMLPAASASSTTPVMLPAASASSSSSSSSPVVEPESEPIAGDAAEGDGSAVNRRRSLLQTAASWLHRALRQAADEADTEPTLLSPGSSGDDSAGAEAPPQGVAAQVEPAPRTGGSPGGAPAKAALLASAQFTVGDPRPPTATLNLNTSSTWVTPGGRVQLSVTAASYVGSDVSGARVSLEWSTAKARGSLELVTDASGVALGSVDLGALPTANRSEPYADSVALRASWVGPTREPLTATKSVTITDGPVRVELRRTLLTDVPGIAFGIAADAFNNEDGAPVKGVSVQVTLAAANGSASVANCSAAQLSALAKQACSVAAGNATAAATCQLAMPCPGDFVLKGCIAGSGGGAAGKNDSSSSSSSGGCSQPIRLGRNLTWWAAAPWSAGPGTLNLLADTVNVTQGSNLTLVVQNPWWGPTSGLLVWGNAERREHKALNEIPHGPSLIRLRNIGPECRGGCRLALLLAVARPPGSSPLDAVQGAKGSGGGGGGAKLASFSSRTSDDSSSSNPVDDAEPGEGADAQQPPAQPKQLAASSSQPSGGGQSARRTAAPWPLNVRLSAPPGFSLGDMFGRGGQGAPAAASSRLERASVEAAGPGSQGARGAAAGWAPGAGALLLPAIPRSVLFDPLSPRTVSAELSLGAPQDGADLSVALEVTGQSKDGGLPVLPPQSKQGRVTASVKDSAGKPVAGAEVTLMMVDKAVLDLLPYELQDVTSALTPSASFSLSLLHLNALRVGRAALNATFATLRRRLDRIDPWLPVDTQVKPGADGPWPLAGGDVVLPPPTAAAVDVPDARYLAGFTTPLTPLPARPCSWLDRSCPAPSMWSRGGAVPMSAAVASDAVAAENVGSIAAVAKPLAAVALAAPAPAPAPPGATAKRANGPAGATAAAPGSGPAGAPAGAQLRLQGAFKVTPLFKVLKTGPDGRVSLDLTAPDNLGRFVLRAYAAAPNPSASAAAAAQDGSKPGSSSGGGGGGPAVVYGAAQAALIVRRAVSLTPSLPRQARVGDNFTAGVLVEAPGTSGDVAVTVTATLVPPPGSGGPQVLLLQGGTSVTVKLSPGKPQQEARFEMAARAIGSQNITFAATTAGAGAGDDASSTPARTRLRWPWQAGRRRLAAAAAEQAGADVADQVQLTLPVLGRQGPVWVATSFAVKGNASGGSGGAWSEGLVLPRAENGSGSLMLVAGVGYLPAVKAAYAGLADQGLSPGGKACTSGSQAVALGVLPALLSAYHAGGGAAGASPSGRAADAAAGFLSSRELALTAAAAQAASQTLTHPRLGLLSTDPACFYPYSQPPERADVSLNAWAAWLVRQAVASNKVLMDVTSSNSNSSSSGPGAALAAWGSLRAASGTWTSALQQQLVADALAARSGYGGRVAPAAYADLEALSWARLVLGPGWAPSSADLQAAASRAGGSSGGASSSSGGVSWAGSSSGSSDGSSGGSSGGGGDQAQLLQQVTKDLSMHRLGAAAAAGNLSVGGQARAGLALLQLSSSGSGGGSKPGSGASGNKPGASGSSGSKPGASGGSSSKPGASGSSGSSKAGGGDAGSERGKPKLAGADAAAMVAKISKRLLGSLRVGGRTAYVATSEGARSAASLPDQAFALSFFVASKAQSPLVQKQAAWVGQGAAPPPLLFGALCPSSSAWESGLRGVSLTSYDAAASSTAPSLQLTAASAPAAGAGPRLASQATPTAKPGPLLNASFSASNAGELVSSNTSWADVPPGGSLVFSAAGRGEATIAASLNFTPSQLLPFPTYRGLWVQRLISVDEPAGGGGGGGSKAASGGGNGGSNAAGGGGIGLGRIVTVTVQVTSPDDQSDVSVEVPMPGGLEPLDPNVAADPDAAAVCSSGDDEPQLQPGSGIVSAAPGGGVRLSAAPRPRPWWPACPAQTTAPAAVRFRFTYLRAGTHTLRFKAVAATSGAFVLPPVKAYVAQQPEVMGLSPAGSLTVCASAAGGCDGGSGAAAAAAPARPCPKDCNRQGTCNLATGRCICDNGFSGEGCGVFAAS